jgi:hypothetical protein
VRADHVLGRQDHQEPASVAALDDLLLDDEPLLQQWIGPDSLLHQVEIVGRLAFIVP